MQNAGVDGGGDSDAMHNPPNPAGLGPAPVELGPTTDLATSGSFVLLAKTGITNVTGSSITGGHVGVSPAAASFITGFAMTADPSNVFSTSASVVAPAKIYASNYAVPTPANLTAAIGSMQTAYTDAAGRTNPDFLNLASGNLGGQTLVPGLYKWGTTVTIPTDVTLAGGANDVWIFQISNDLDLSTSKNMILSGGAQAKNIYWQVAGKVTIHSSSHFEGIILAKTGITLQTTATLHGRALAQTLVALDNNAITAP
ncbi:MAG TPA: ice-binding family protein [Kofleriaceae bacterium]